MPDSLDQLELQDQLGVRSHPMSHFHVPDASGGAQTDDHTAADAQLAEMRKRFLQAEVAIGQGDEQDYKRLAAQLQDYILYPYLQYQWLRKHLGASRQIAHFLQQYGDTRYATLLKHRWLHHLGKKRHWKTFLKHYSGSSDTTLQCYLHRAQFNTGKKQQAMAGAKKLWVAGRSQPRACDPLFVQLKKTPAFDAELFWRRFDAAMQRGNIRLAKYVKSLMSPRDQSLAQLWLKLHRQPQHNLDALLRHSERPYAAAMFSHAIKRLARQDIDQAIELWEQNRQHFALSETDVQTVERKLAFRLAFNHDPRAFEWLGRLADADHVSRTWRVRMALAAQDWSRVIQAIEDLTAQERQSEKWQYWLARAYAETGRPQQADQLFTGLAGQRDFYGYLAADRLGLDYKLADMPLQVTLQAIDAVAQQKPFQVAFELMALDRPRQARQQWWFALRRIDREQIAAAAKLAQLWQWHDVAILTIAKVRYWDDIDLRFPLGFHNEIQANAMLHDVAPAILFGIIRRESVFNENARSPAGALGLMQLMPKTARHVARLLNERWQGTASLYEPERNLKYGAYYYRYLLNQFDGQFAVALAAYNAGPNRVKEWLPDEAMPADIWIETIPFRETRNYVTSVLVYSMIYQQRVQAGDMQLSELVGDVQPVETLALEDKVLF